MFALNFGLPAALPANRAIAAPALRASRAQKIPVFCAPLGIFDVGDYPCRLCADIRGYISTVKQVRVLVETARQQAWRRVLIIAVAPHRWRALRDVRAAGFEAEVDDSLRALRRGLWYARESGTSPNHLVVSLVLYLGATRPCTDLRMSAMFRAVREPRKWVQAGLRGRFEFVLTEPAVAALLCSRLAA